MGLVGEREQVDSSAKSGRNRPILKFASLPPGNSATRPMPERRIASGRIAFGRPAASRATTIIG
jgi:hypothetical protein